MATPTLLPFFDNIGYLAQNPQHVILPDERFRTEFMQALHFLKSYTGSLGTFNGYRRETERLLQWSWRIKKVSIALLKRDDIEQYLRFCQNPPESWISLKKVPRFIEQGGLRKPNPDWRPFVATLKKAHRKAGEQPTLEDFSLSQGAIQEIFAILSTFFNFLIAEEYLTANPIALIRQKSKFIRKTHGRTPIRRLSQIQWQAIHDTVETLAQQEPNKHERTRFILNILLGMYLRISELTASERWMPAMNHFFKDSQGNWWFLTVGKGNKERQVAVNDDILASLARWRRHLGLTPLPSPSDNSPLIPRIRGKGPMSDTAPLRRILQYCFDLAEEKLRCENQTEEADNLASATVHWLRHTGISEDVKTRPREHVRDDAGHSSSATTDRYIDVEMQERHRTAREKTALAQMSHCSLDEA